VILSPFVADRLDGAAAAGNLGVSWQDELPGGVVVSNRVAVTLDVEAILLDDLERTGAIEQYREAGRRR